MYAISYSAKRLLWWSKALMKSYDRGYHVPGPWKLCMSRVEFSILRPGLVNQSQKLPEKTSGISTAAGCRHTFHSFAGLHQENCLKSTWNSRSWLTSMTFECPLAGTAFMHGFLSLQYTVIIWLTVIVLECRYPQQSKGKSIIKTL